MFFTNSAIVVTSLVRSHVGFLLNYVTDKIVRVVLTTLVLMVTCVQTVCACVWGRDRVCAFRTVPLLPIRRVRSLRRAPTPGGAPSQLLKKKKKNVTRHSHIRTRARLHLMFCDWMQMIIIDGQLCPWKDIRNPPPRKKKKWKRSPCFTFR